MERTGTRVPVTHVVRGLSITVPWGDDFDQHLTETGDYEPATQRLLERILKPGMTMIDAGAHVGIFTLIGARLVGPAGHVHAYEADPVTATWLRDNVERNELTNVTVHAAALGDHEGTATFYAGSDAAVGSLRAPREDSYRSRQVTVPMTTLPIARVGVIKMDVEGGELAALAPIRAMLTEHHPTIIIEFASQRQQAFGHTVQELAEVLRSCGYALFALDTVEPLRVTDGIYNVVAFSHKD